MDEVLVEALVGISESLDIIAVILLGILGVQFFTLICKDNNGGFYLGQINETLKDIINKHNK